ncbi:glutathione S-transferase family protein [Roseomonas indoligenes]|uniref:Glutathione S-transferase family protein n=1 Tax=Roseomonas indoligenes TaxID=2820811 RepID=A0A940S5V3_9PROT|nr:glutathione S-transferase family protein [Pararoseomonas indoligenes]MBP0493394.1 glutathione S-transferase family protein [Pararoseomonas indoligenes]
MSVILHDLCGADPSRRFSPYCWRVRMALAHKGIPHEALPWRFTEKATIADAGTDKVPVLRHDGRTVHESWTILEYLEDHWPGVPSLFGGEGGRALARFVNTWSDAVVAPAIAKMVVSDIPGVLAPEDAAYFVQSREKRFGMALAEVTAGRDAAVEAFRRDLHPLRMVLRERPWLSGTTAGAADYIAFGPLQWARCVSAFPLLTPDDPVHAWRGRLLDAFGGMARNAPAEDLT